jgi:hypothetical protein
LAGAILVVGTLLLWFADFGRAALDAAGWWLLALAAVMGIHSLLEYPLWYSYFLGMAAFLLGFGARRFVVPRLTVAVRLVAGLALFAGWFNLAAALPPYREFERLVFMPAAREAAQSQDEASFARAVVGLYREPFLVPYVEAAIATGATVNEDRVRDKLDVTARAVRFAPTPFLSYRYAMLLALAGQFEAALAQFKRSLRVYPEEAGEAVAELRSAARDRPDAIRPLLELAAARAALPGPGPAGDTKAK